jgi:hypothetical protein
VITNYRRKVEEFERPEVKYHEVRTGTLRVSFDSNEDDEMCVFMQRNAFVNVLSFAMFPIPLCCPHAMFRVMAYVIDLCACLCHFDDLQHSRSDIQQMLLFSSFHSRNPVLHSGRGLLSCDAVW